MSVRSHLVLPRLGATALVQRSFVERLFDSLGYEAGLRHDREGHLAAWKLDLPRYIREIGFNRSMRARECAAAYLNSLAWEPAIRAQAAGHARVERRVKPDHSGEVAWLPVLASEATGETAPVYDVVTGDAAASFLEDGVVVHNCGNKAARTNVRAEDIRADLSGIMESVFSRISFGVGRKNDEPVDHAVLDAIKRADFAPQRQLYDLAAKQLGTVGSGNHYVDLFEDEDGWVWVGVHFGSRGFGHKTASGFLALAQGLKFDEHATEGEMDSPPVLLHTDSDLGQSYIAAMSLAGEYAYAGRDTVVEKVLEILGAEATEEVHNHHNFAWRESHFGTDVWVIRKGCTPAFPDQLGFVGATMGEPSVILRGAESDASRDLLYSTVHGAGRVMSRTKAAGKLRTRAQCSVRDCEFDVPWNQRHDAGCPRHPLPTRVGIASGQRHEMPVVVAHRLCQVEQRLPLGRALTPRQALA
jgi:tRNA-splicing ligase RtcB